MTQPLTSARARRPLSAYTRLFGTGDLNPGERCAIIVAHPADEVVGAGCLISKLVNVSVLHVTDGAPRDTTDATDAGFKEISDYAEARKQECLSALALANVPQDRVVELAIPDHAAPERLAEITKQITSFLQRSGADIVVTHPYEGGHPDHDATAFATHAAVRLMKHNGFRPPVIFEMALHPSDDGISRVPEFLPGSKTETTTLLLDAPAQALKRRMFDCFDTQRKSLQTSPIGPEKFRRPAEYDFSVPPHMGRLHYELFDSSIKSEEWQSLARKALADLFSGGGGSGQRNTVT
ncbi:MAG: PIG-L family deacetylase [Acidobacteriota bacterium]|nr:PIG-L family deacetylase [Acidobacteriota bacterium]